MGLFDRPRAETASDEPLKPVPETFSGTVLPGGRGQELHGVHLEGHPDLVDDVEMGDLVRVPRPPDEPDPIPVRVIGSSRRELKRWRVIRYTLTSGSPAVQILGHDDKRTKVTIRNTGETVYLGTSASDTTEHMGFPLATDSELTLSAETEVYAVLDAAAVDPTGAIVMLVEYVTDAAG